MRWLTLILGVAILAGVASVVIVLRDGNTGSGTASAGQTTPATPALGSPTHSEFTDPCGTFETAATTPYAVSGYWLIPTSDP